MQVVLGARFRKTDVVAKFMNVVNHSCWGSPESCCPLRETNFKVVVKHKNVRLDDCFSKSNALFIGRVKPGYLSFFSWSQFSKILPSVSKNLSIIISLLIPEFYQKNITKYITCSFAIQIFNVLKMRFRCFNKSSDTLLGKNSVKFSGGGAGGLFSSCAVFHVKLPWMVGKHSPL